MHLKRSPRALEWNLNTIISLATLAGMIVGLLGIWINSQRDIGDLKQWTASHEQLHRERLAEVKEKEGALNSRIGSIEKDADTSERQVDNLVYRVTILEQNRDALTKAVQELQGAIQKLATNQEVSTEILQRLDRAINNKQGPQ